MDTPENQIKARLRADIEATAKAVNLEPTTLGRKLGQGGRFYARLSDPSVRVWPSTARAAHEALEKLRSDKSHGSKCGTRATPGQDARKVNATASPERVKSA